LAIKTPVYPSNIDPIIPNSATSGDLFPFSQLAWLVTTAVNGPNRPSSNPQYLTESWTTKAIKQTSDYTQYQNLLCSPTLLLSISTFLKSIWGFIGPMLDNRFLHAFQLEPGGCDTEHWSPDQPDLAVISMAWSKPVPYDSSRQTPWRILTVLLYTVCHGSHQYTPVWWAYIPAPWIHIETERSSGIYRITCIDWAHISGHFQGDWGPGCPGAAPKWEGHGFSSWKTVRTTARKTTAQRRVVPLISGDLRWCRNQRLQSAEKCRHLLPAAEIFGTPNLAWTWAWHGLTTWVH